MNNRRQCAVWMVGLAAMLCAGLLTTSASAATISGTITNDSGTGIPMDARLWSVGAKGLTISQTVRANAAGAYSFTTVSAGTYKVDARMPAGFTGNYGDRWFDAQPPHANGWIAADADEIVVTANDTVTNIDIAMPVNGGVDGEVRIAGAPRNGIYTRIESTNDFRIHHNHTTKTTSGPGMYSMRGLPPGTYRLLVHDPDGNYRTEVVTTGVTISGNNNGTGPTVNMVAMPADPREPNNAAGNAGAAIDISALRATPPRAFETTNASISPRNGDIDWYCWDGLPGERYEINTVTPLDVEGTIRENPWVDPVVSFWSGNGTSREQDDDDSGKGRNGFIDTNEITAADRYCVAVSMYGDTGWNGNSQTVAGSYGLRIEMGNRRPQLDGTWSTELEMPQPLPMLPTPVVVDEGTSLQIDLIGTDPDFDPLIYGATLTDTSAQTVMDGQLNVVGGNAAFLWDVGEQAASGSPYTVRLTASDGEYSATLPVTIVVNGINRAPTMPVHLSPEDGAIVPMTDVVVTIENGTDADGDPISYEFEAYFDTLDGTPDQTGTVSEDASGQTTWTVAGVPENTLVSWRVRATDGMAMSGDSMWTEPWVFQVDSENDAPITPVLVKPEDGSELIEQLVTLSAENTLDPEGHAISLTFEVARDSAFTDLVLTSPEVPQSEMGATTAWTAETPLAWGATYYARVFAMDEYGAISEASNVHIFSLAANTVPSPPDLSPSFGRECAARVIPAPTEFNVINGVDADGQELTVQLQIFLSDDDPESAAPLLDLSMPASGQQTNVPIDSTIFEEGRQYLVRVRMFDGSDGSEWMGCDFWVGFQGEGGGDINGSKEGCGCAVRSDQETLWAPAGLILLGLVAVLRRKRRADDPRISA